MAGLGGSTGGTCAGVCAATGALRAVAEAALMTALRSAARASASSSRALRAALHMDSVEREHTCKLYERDTKRAPARVIHVAHKTVRIKLLLMRVPR